METQLDPPWKVEILREGKPLRAEPTISVRTDPCALRFFEAGVPNMSDTSDVIEAFRSPALP